MGKPGMPIYKYWCAGKYSPTSFLGRKSPGFDHFCGVFSGVCGLIMILGSLSATGWGCVPVLLVVWHRVYSTEACWSLSEAGSSCWDGDLWEIFAVWYYVELGGLLWPVSWSWLSHLRGTALMPGWSTKSLSSTWLRIKGRKNRKKERKWIK